MMAPMDSHLLPDVLTFLNVVRSGSITKAANQLNTVQSNVTARIKKLEEALGVPLLSRHARGVRVTSGGEAVLPIALRLDALLNDLGYAFGQRIPLKQAKLRLGAIETVAAIQLPRLVSQFLRDSPHVDISVQVGSSSRLIKQVKDGDLDAAFVSRRFGLPNFREELVFKDKLVALAPTTIRTLSALHSAVKNGLKVMVQRLGCSYTDAAENLRPNAEFDVIFCNSVLHWFRDPARALAACKRALRPAGRIGLQAPARQDYCPNFLKGIAKVACHPETAATFSRFRSPWFLCETGDEYAEFCRDAGFIVPFARIEETSARYSPEQVLKVFESGAAAGYLNATCYGVPMPNGYVESFRRILADAFRAQADGDGQVELVFHRIYLVAVRPD